MNTLDEIKKNISGNISSYIFVSNSIQIAANFEILNELKSKIEKFNIYWLGHRTTYPSIMARNYDSFGKIYETSEIKRICEKIFGAKLQYSSDLEVDKIFVSDKIMKFKKTIRDVYTIDQLIKIEIDDLKPGPAIANALVFESQNRNVNIQQNISKILNLFESYVKIYSSVIKEIKEHNSSSFLIYNGRFLHERAVWDAAKKHDKTILIFETIRNRYLVRDFGFHDRIANQKEMLNLWNSSKLSVKDREEKGSKYFHDLKSKSNKYYVTKDFEESERGEYFVFYTNSDDEAIGFWETWKENFLSQKEAIEYLSKWFGINSRFKFIVRLHPNLLSKPVEIRNEWLNLNLDSKTVLIEPSEKTSSYSLMSKAKGVISFGSTIGLEASYHEIPSLVLADCWYDELNAVSKANDLEGMLDWINKVSNGDSSVNKSKEGALVRGYWMEMSGNEFKETQLTELSWGSWRAKSFRKIPIQSSKIRRNFHILINKSKRLKQGFRRN